MVHYLVVIVIFLGWKKSGDVSEDQRLMYVAGWGGILMIDIAPLFRPPIIFFLITWATSAVNLRDLFDFIPEKLILMQNCHPSIHLPSHPCIMRQYWRIGQRYIYNAMWCDARTQPMQPPAKQVVMSAHTHTHTHTLSLSLSFLPSNEMFFGETS